MQPELFNHLVSLRRDLHANPELGYKEFRTASIICDELNKLGIQYKTKVAKTGVVAEIKKGEGACIVLRADMDALPINEEAQLSFVSKIKNVMHACGHDIHTTILIGAAYLLKEKKFSGTIKFIFQPSEEGNYDDPEKKSGGERIAETELEGVKAAVSLHVHPLLPVGKIGFALGQSLACANFFKITILGKAGHAGAAHHLAIDSIMIASALIQSLQTIVSRYTNAVQPAVLSFTKIEGGSAPNIIADRVFIEGTIRAFDLNIYNDIKARLELMSKGVADTYGATVEVEYLLDYPSLLNDKNVHQELSSALDSVFKNENVIEVDRILGGEDFAFYSRKIPSMFYFLGANHNSAKYFLHHPKVLFDEECIKYGSEFLAKAALALL